MNGGCVSWDFDEKTSNATSTFRYSFVSESNARSLWTAILARKPFNGIIIVVVGTQRAVNIR